MNLENSAKSAVVSSTSSSVNITAENVVKSFVLHVVEIIGMCQDMLTKRCVCVINAIKSGWLIRSALIT